MTITVEKTIIHKTVTSKELICEYIIFVFETRESSTPRKRTERRLVEVERSNVETNTHKPKC